MKFVDFTKKEYEEIVDRAMLSPELTKILEYKIKGYSRDKIAMTMTISTATLDRQIKLLKKKIKKVL